MTTNDMRGLWRGKTTPKRSGEAFDSIWVEGNLIQSEGSYYIHPFANSVKVQGELGRLIVMHEVEPSTLGECTGLTDKNGTLIFEGDFIKNLDDGKIWLVVWSNSGAGYVCKDRIDCYNTIGTDCYRTTRTKIIGNIHDNPELLKGDDNP